jgi:uncharacterized protein YbjT (DUF2867 family)
MVVSITENAKEAVMSEHREGTILVAVGTGKTGRRVVERLRARDLPVRVGSRTAEPAFDWDTPSTWAPALDGIDQAYVSFFPDLSVPSASEAIAAFTQTAAEKGVRRLVLLSGRGEDAALACERIVQGSGLEWTIVRASWFSQNFSEDFLYHQVMAGQVALPIDGVVEPFIDAEDIADVAVAALTEPGHLGEIYEVTGPRLMTFADAVAEIARASGRSVRFTSISMADFLATLRQQQIPDDAVALVEFLFTEVLDGRNEVLTDGVMRALGRPPVDFAEYARRAAVAGAWDGER